MGNNEEYDLEGIPAKCKVELARNPQKGLGQARSMHLGSLESLEKIHGNDLNVELVSLKSVPLCFQVPGNLMIFRREKRFPLCFAYCGLGFLLTRSVNGSPFQLVPPGVPLVCTRVAPNHK